MCGRHWLPARPPPHPTLRRTNTSPRVLWPLPSSTVAVASPLVRRSLGGTPPSRTPPASGVRGDMPTKGALTGLHGGYSEPGAGAARSAGATQMTCARGALGLAAEQCWQRTWSDLKNTKSEF